MRVCIIGETGHVNYVFRGLDKLKDIDIIGVAPGSNDENIEHMYDKIIESGYNPQKYDNYIDMLYKLKPQITVIACHFSLHAKVAIDVLKAGSHIFIEKPIALNITDLEKVREVYYKANLHLCAMFGIRYEQAFLTAWYAVKAGKIGNVRIMNAQKSYKLGKRPDLFTLRETYGGTIPWVGSHAIDWLHWFSQEKFTSVFAAHSTMYNKGLGEMEMSALCHFTFTNEVFGSVNIDYLRHENAPNHGDDRIRIAGTNGVIEVRDNKVFLINSDKVGEQQLDLLPEQNIFVDFIKQVRGEGVCLVSAEDSFEVTKACLLARQSADENRLINIL